MNNISYKLTKKEVQNFDFKKELQKLLTKYDMVERVKKQLMKSRKTGKVISKSQQIQVNNY